MVVKFLRIEGLVIFFTAIVLYFSEGLSTLLFLLLLFTPDVSMVGYLKDNSTGAWLYNLGHTYALPLTLFLISFFLHSSLGYAFTLIWLAHIGMDRMFGFGLKYVSGFKDTHLGRIGRKLE